MVASLGESKAERLEQNQKERQERMELPEEEKEIRIKEQHTSKAYAVTAGNQVIRGKIAKRGRRIRRRRRRSKRSQPEE